MLTRLVNVLRSNVIGIAMRQSRQIAGGIAGTFFTLGGIFKVPLDKFLFGVGPAATTLFLAFLSFMHELIQGYRRLDSECAENLLHRNNKHTTTKWLLDQFHKDDAKFFDFLTKNKLSESDIDRIMNWGVVSFDDIHDLLLRIHQHSVFDVTKYPISVTCGIMQAASHYMECLLLQVYADKGMFNLYSETLQIENILLIMIIALSGYNGMTAILESKAEFENPDYNALCVNLVNAYNAHTVEADNTDTMPNQVILSQVV